MNHTVAANDAGGPVTGIVTALRRLFAAAIAHLATRGELLVIEYAEERERLFLAAIAAAVTVVAGLFALGFAATLALLLAWNTPYQWAVAIALPVVFTVLAAGGWWAFRTTIQRPSALFRTSLMELRRDVEAVDG